MTLPPHNRQKQYSDVLKYLKRGLFDPAGFARLIDVAECRKKGIHPLESRYFLKIRALSRTTGIEHGFLEKTADWSP